MKHSFFQRALEGNNKWWTFLAGMLMVFAGFNIGQLPLSVIANYKIMDMVSSGAATYNECLKMLLSYDFKSIGFSSNFSFFLILLGFVGGILFLYFSVVKVNKRPFKSIITPNKKINWGKIAFGFAIWFLLSFSIEGFSLFMNPENYVWTFNLKAFIPLLLMCIFLLPLQTSFEEVFMRGYIMQGIPLHPNTLLLCIIGGGGLIHVLALFQGQMLDVIDGNPIDATAIPFTALFYAILFIIVGVMFYMEKQGKIKLGLYTLVRKPITPLIITSLMFGLMHGANPEIAEFGLGKMMTFYIGMGLFLGLITLLDESLELALGVHFANNLFGALFVSFDGSALQTPTLFRSLEMNTDYMLVGWFGMVAIFMAAAYFKYRWKNWGKLFETIQYDTTNANVEDIAFLENGASLADVDLNDDIA